MPQESVPATEALAALAEALAAEAAAAQAEGDDASTDKWALCCFSSAVAFRRARSMALLLATKLAAPPQAAPETATPKLIYPIDPTPDNIRELGAQCSGCGRTHDVSGLVYGNRVWCPCGHYLSVPQVALDIPF